MIEVTNSPGRAGAEWNASRRINGRREPKAVYRSGYSARNGSISPYGYETLPDNQGIDIPLSRSPLSQPPSAQFSPYFTDYQLFDGNAQPTVVNQQNGPFFSSYSPSIPNTLASNSPSSAQVYGRNNPQSPNGFSPVSSEKSEMQWPTPGQAGSDTDDMPMSGLQLGTFGPLGSMMMPTPSPISASVSDGYVDVSSAFGNTDAQQQLGDLALSNDFFPVSAFSPTASFSPTSSLLPDDFCFEPTASPILDNSMPDNISIRLEHWSDSPLSFRQPGQTLQGGTVDTLPQAPWNSQDVYANNFLPSTGFGEATCGFGRNFSYNTTGSMSLQVEQPIMYGPEPVSPGGNSENSWQMVPSHASSEAPSYGSPRSHASPEAHPPSPYGAPTQEFEAPHPHVLNFKNPARVSKTKLPRGRQRGLTAVEKKQARDVRDAKACWACHISKTKCSPCSPGKPCEQCARLDGKRRFCNFSCFNDPLEALHKFMVPDYLMGHFTRQNVESFVTRNAGWGTNFLRVRMTWGYRKYLEVDVVTMTLRSGPNDMAVQHQTIQNGTSRPILLRKASPPLGIPLDAMDDLQDSYSRYIHEIVSNDLAEYVPVAYTDQDSKLPERLLGAVCQFYRTESESDSQSDLLRRAIEMHVTAVILERSLILDPDSLDRVQGVLGQEFPRRSAPRCAQRQIKLAFFELQRRRIERVMKDWGNMMWATNTPLSKDKDWAISFSVFLILTLVMDKTLGAAYFFCEGKIKNYDREPRAEKMAFANLVRLTQNELFDRCKEIFHWKFKTRKGGKEACNPIRDGIRPFLAKTNSIDPSVGALVKDLQSMVEIYEQDIKTPTSKKHGLESEYMDAGRLACIFLNDFVSR